MIKHYIADFPLQNYYQILGLIRSKHPYLMSMALHGVFHGIMTAGVFFLAGLYVTGEVLIGIPLLLGVIDGVVHSLIDSGVLVYGQRTGYTLQNDTFRYLFGLDQMLHNLTYVGLIWLFIYLIHNVMLF